MYKMKNAYARELIEREGVKINMCNRFDVCCFCIYGPASSGDGKPCCMCPTSGREIKSNSDHIRAMTEEELADNRVGEIKGIAPYSIWFAADIPEKMYTSKKVALEVEADWLRRGAESEK